MRKQVLNVERWLKIPTHCVVCGELVPQERVKYKAITCSEQHKLKRKAALARGDRSCKCVICTAPVSRDRTRYSAITCSEEHKRMRKESIRARRIAGRCDFCHKPSTPAERAAFARFRSIELSRPDILYPETWQKWQADGGDLRGFAQAIEENAIQLKLRTRANKETPGGAGIGRPRLKWKGGDADCEHRRRVQRADRKPLAENLRDTCANGCGAVIDKGE